MSDFSVYVSILFRLINFGAVIAVGIFWYKRSLRVSMTELMHKKKHKEEALEQEKNELIAHQRAVEQEQKEQELESKNLLGTIHAWRNAVEQSFDKATREREALQDKAVARVEKQEKQWHFLALQQAVLTPTLKKTREELQEKYADKKPGDRYIQTIIDELKQRA